MTSRNKAMPFKVSSEERKFIKDQSKSNGLDVSKYIRSRLFEDQDLEEKKERAGGDKKVEKDLIKLVVHSYNLLIKMAEKNLPESELEDAIKKSSEWLEKNKYN